MIELSVLEQLCRPCGREPNPTGANETCGSIGLRNNLALKAKPLVPSRLTDAWVTEFEANRRSFFHQLRTHRASVVQVEKHVIQKKKHIYLLLGKEQTSALDTDQIHGVETRQKMHRTSLCKNVGITS